MSSQIVTQFFFREQEKARRAQPAENSLLVKNIVSRQKDFVSLLRIGLLRSSKAAALRNGLPRPSLRSTNPTSKRRIADTSVQLCQQLQIFRNETRFEKPNPAAVSGHRQLGREHEFRTAAASRSYARAICSQFPSNPDGRLI